jgi:hypothetical protein
MRMSDERLERWTYVSTGLPIGLALGVGIWVLSASITGRAEPWDASGMYYPAALLAAGFVGGFLVPGHWGEVAVGVYAGQALVLLGRVLSDTGGGGLWLLGLVVLALYSLIALASALLGSGLRRLANRRR